MSEATEERVISTAKLGLAAYIKMSGASIDRIDPDERVFTFKDSSGKSLEDYELEYMNTCCYRHDNELVHLRRLMLKK